MRLTCTQETWKTISRVLFIGKTVIAGFSTPINGAGLRSDPSHTSGAICWLITNNRQQANNKTTSYYLPMMVPLDRLDNPTEGGSRPFHFSLNENVDLNYKQALWNNKTPRLLTKVTTRLGKLFESSRQSLPTSTGPLRANSLSFHILHHRRDAH